LLAEAQRGTPAALEAVFEATYAQLRHIAGALMRRERPGHTLQPTELVHDAWFKLIDQSDMIVSLVPELPSGKPGLSSGVERELQHAYETTKEVYVVWQPKADPSPFITETATKIFSSGCVGTRPSSSATASFSNRSDRNRTR